MSAKSQAELQSHYIDVDSNDYDDDEDRVPKLVKTSGFQGQTHPEGDMGPKKHSPQHSGAGHLVRAQDTGNLDSHHIHQLGTITTKLAGFWWCACTVASGHLSAYHHRAPFSIT